MATINIPLDNIDPAFRFLVDLDQVSYTLKFRFNSRINIWVYDVIDSEGEPIYAGIPFYTEVISPLQTVSSKSPKGLLYVINSENQGVDGGRFDIGNSVEMFYDEVET